MDGQDPTQKQIEVLQKAESCVTCTPSMVNSCCRTTQGATSTTTCTQQCQDYGTNTRLFDGSNCFCFDTQPTCDQLESSTQACKKGQNKNCFTGIALDKQKDKKSACETSCKVFGKDKTLVCKDKCYCLAPAKEPPVKKKIVEHMDTCTSSCPDEYKCSTSPNGCMTYITDGTKDGYIIPNSLGITDNQKKIMRCECDSDMKTTDDPHVVALWKQAVSFIENCKNNDCQDPDCKDIDGKNITLLQKFKDLLPGTDDGLKTSIAQLMCKYSNMTDPRKAPPEPSLGSKGWFMNILTNPVLYGFATFLIYLLYMRILLCTFYPRNIPAARGNPFLFSVFDSFWLQRGVPNADVLTLVVLIVTGLFIGGLSAKYEVIPTLIEKGFGTRGDGWFWILVGMMVVPAVTRFIPGGLGLLSTMIRILITLCFLLFSAIIIALNLFMAYLSPSIAIIILLSYRIISGMISSVSTLAAPWKDGLLVGLEWITGMTPADRWVIPFLPNLGIIAKIAHIANNTTSLYFTRQTLGTIIGCGDPNLFGS